MLACRVRNLFSVLLVGLVVLLAGCAAPQQQQTVEDIPDTALLRVAQVDQYTRLGDKRADGQYVVVLVQLKNVSKQVLTITPNDWKLQNITENEADRYSIPPERGMTTGFTKVYGKEVQDKIIDFGSFNVNPQVDIQRYLVFSLPQDASLDGYELVYTPGGAGGAVPTFGGGGAPTKKPAVAKLADPEATVNDYRQK